MKGFARIFKSEEAVYIRFERIGDRQKFDLIMDRFNQTFQLKDWNNVKRAWELVPTDLDAVIEFCSTIFGRNGYMLSEDNTPPKESQLSIQTW